MQKILNNDNKLIVIAFFTVETPDAECNALNPSLASNADTLEPLSLLTSALLLSLPSCHCPQQVSLFQSSFVPTPHRRSTDNSFSAEFHRNNIAAVISGHNFFGNVTFFFSFSLFLSLLSPLPQHLPQ